LTRSDAVARKTAVMVAEARAHHRRPLLVIIGALSTVVLSLVFLFAAILVVAAVFAGMRPDMASEEGSRYIVEPVISDFMTLGGSEDTIA
jgi:hypothetical protein